MSIPNHADVFRVRTCLSISLSVLRTHGISILLRITENSV